MNDHEAENDLRDYYTSITPATSVHATGVVSDALRARRASRARYALTTKPRTFASLAVVVAVALVVVVGYGTWRAGPNNGFPSVASESPSLHLPTPSPTAEPTDTPTPRPSPTLRAPTKSTPSHQFSLTGSMHGHFDTATLLDDGRVLMTGDHGDQVVGAYSYVVYSTSAELYDPGTGVFTPTGPLLQARGGSTATKLQDGRVLIAGGSQWLFTADGPQLEALSSAELYDPATGQFTVTGSMAQPRLNHTATLLGDGEVLIAGGEVGSRILASAELYDPKSGTFKPTGSMASSRSTATATLLADGRAMVFAGRGQFLMRPTTVEVYDPRTGAFNAAGSVPEWEQGRIVTRLTDGYVLTEGGPDGGPTAYELYDPATGSFGRAGSPTISGDGRAAVLLADGQVLFAGGGYSPQEGDVQPGPHVGTVALASSGGRERYDLPAPTPAAGTEAIGATAPVTILATAELYDPTIGKFTRTGSLVLPRVAATATLLLDGRVLIAGGDMGTGLTAELYQP